MNADDFRQFYEYHFTENRKIWDTYIVPLSQEQFTQPVAYSVGSLRNQIVHLMSADEQWFTALRGLDMPDWLNPADFDERKTIRAYWDKLEQSMRADLAALRDEQLADHPLPNGEDQKLIRWQILLHVTTHGADHRAQILRLLNDLGVQTGPQDYIFYLFDQPY